MNESKNLRNKIIITNDILYIKIITDTNTNGKKNGKKKSEVNKRSLMNTIHAVIMECYITEYVKHAESVALFKRKLKTFLFRKIFS